MLNPDYASAARLAQALAGSYGMYRADADEKKAGEDRSSKLAGVMVKMKTDPEGGLADLSALDPEIGARAAAQMAVERMKINRQNEGLNQVAGTYGGMPASPPSGDPLDRSANATAGIESGGRYEAVGPVANKAGNRAYGKYQVLDTNIGPWTQEILGRQMTTQEFLASPQAQDAVYKGKMGQYVQQYGSPEAASRAWFAGPGGMNNPNASDVNGMTVQRYGQKFAQAYGPGATGGQAPPQGAAPPAPPVTVQATPPGQPQPLQINVTPNGGPQGSAENNGTPPTPSPQGVQGPTMVAPPQLPQRMTPRDMPPQFAAPYVDRFRRGGYGRENPAQAEQAMVAHMQRDLDASFENQKLEYQRLQGDYEYNRQRGDKQTGDDQKRRLDAVEHDRRESTKPMNDTQSLAATYADRMAEANAVVAKLPASVQTAGQGDLVGSIPLIGNFAANQVRSADYQKYQQAKNNFIYSQLRKESGAAIGKDEYVAADRQYFPQPGDSKEVIAQKEINRQIAVDGMSRNAGPTYRPTQSRSSTPSSGSGDGTRQRISLDGKPL